MHGHWPNHMARQPQALVGSRETPGGAPAGSTSRHLVAALSLCHRSLWGCGRWSGHSAFTWPQQQRSPIPRRLLKVVLLAACVCVPRNKSPAWHDHFTSAQKERQRHTCPCITKRGPRCVAGGREVPSAAASPLAAAWGGKNGWQVCPIPAAPNALRAGTKYQWTGKQWVVAWDGGKGSDQRPACTHLRRSAPSVSGPMGEQKGGKACGEDGREAEGGA